MFNGTISFVNEDLCHLNLSFKAIFCIATLFTTTSYANRLPVNRSDILSPIPTEEMGPMVAISSAEVSPDCVYFDRKYFQLEIGDGTQNKGTWTSEHYLVCFPLIPFFYFLHFYSSMEVKTKTGQIVSYVAQIGQADNNRYSQCTE